MTLSLPLPKDKVCSLSLHNENTFKNCLIVLFFKNSLPGKFSSKSFSLTSNSCVLFFLGFLTFFRCNDESSPDSSSSIVFKFFNTEIFFFSSP